jgi:hypothetical protein
LGSAEPAGDEQNEELKRSSGRHGDDATASAPVANC